MASHTSPRLRSRIVEALSRTCTSDAASPRAHTTTPPHCSIHPADPPGTSRPRSTRTSQEPSGEQPTLERKALIDLDVVVPEPPGPYQNVQPTGKLLEMRFERDARTGTPSSGVEGWPTHPETTAEIVLPGHPHSDRLLPPSPCALPAMLSRRDTRWWSPPGLPSPKQSRRSSRAPAGNRSPSVGRSGSVGATPRPGRTGGEQHKAHLVGRRRGRDCRRQSRRHLHRHKLRRIRI